MNRAVKVAESQGFCEGPAFGSDGKLYTVDLTGGKISRISTGGDVELFTRVPAPNGQQFSRDGKLLVCDVLTKGILIVGLGGQVEAVVDSHEGKPFNGPNDIVVDGMGGFYFSDPFGSTLSSRTGVLYYVDRLGRTFKVDEELAFPNGVNVSADGEHLVMAETLTRRILRYSIAQDGTLTDKTLFYELKHDGYGPDGMAFDKLGNLYIAHFGAGRIEVVNSDGNVIDQIPIPGKHPTNCCFGPPGSDSETHLFVTEIDTQCVWRYDVGRPGMCLHSVDIRI